LALATLEVRLGGIYALEKVAEDAPEKYHCTVMEVLTAYVRENAARRDPLRRGSRSEVWPGEPRLADAITTRASPT
jgi:hypothetical protein